MNLNPESALERLKARIDTYLKAPGTREEETRALEATIHNAELTLGNMAARGQRDAVYQKLVLTVELAKGELKQQTRAARGY